MRDLKPENILIEKNSTKVFLCDFGWASYSNDTKWLMRKAGTFSYMALEQLKGSLQCPKCDVWALGILLYELYYNVEPY